MTSLNTLTDKALAFTQCFQKLCQRLQQRLEMRQFEKLKSRHDLKRICNAVEDIVEGTDVRMKGICNYQQQLCQCACDLLDHLENLVASIPSPLVIDSNTLTCDPLVRTLLSDMDTVQRLLIRNRDIQEFFNSRDNSNRDQVYALLFIRHREKTILGSEIRGEILLKEVLQKTINFYGHRLIGPSPSEEDVRFEMLLTLFESVIRYIKDQFLQEKKKLIEQKNDYANLHPEENINNPEVYINRLVKELSVPEELIKLRDNLVRVNKMGIKLKLESPAPSNLLRLYELSVGDAESCVVTIIRYPKNGLSDRRFNQAISY